MNSLTQMKLVVIIIIYSTITAISSKVRNQQVRDVWLQGSWCRCFNNKTHLWSPNRMHTHFMHKLQMSGWDENVGQNRICATPSGKRAKRGWLVGCGAIWNCFLLFITTSGSVFLRSLGSENNQWVDAFGLVNSGERQCKVILQVRLAMARN